MCIIPTVPFALVLINWWLIWEDKKKTSTTHTCMLMCACSPFHTQALAVWSWGKPWELEPGRKTENGGQQPEQKHLSQTFYGFFFHIWLQTGRNTHNKTYFMLKYVHIRSRITQHVAGVLSGFPPSAIITTTLTGGGSIGQWLALPCSPRKSNSLRLNRLQIQCDGQFVAVVYNPRVFASKPPDFCSTNW